MGIVVAMVKDLEHIEIVRQWKEELEAHTDRDWETTF